ncbi:uncharacterized protein DS421_17g593380 [Arachis hypogaea]|nr:uncharacterized protein DS421_17g593380 [Arachis hypogaea]
MLAGRMLVLEVSSSKHSAPTSSKVYSATTFGSCSILVHSLGWIFLAWWRNFTISLADMTLS